MHFEHPAVSASGQCTGWWWAEHYEDEGRWVVEITHRI